MRQCRIYLSLSSNYKTGYRLQEAELIQHLQKGDEAAYQQLVALYGDKLYNITLGFLQNEADADDAVQDVFVKVFLRIGVFRGEAALGTWLYRIAVAHSLDLLRKKKRQQNGSLWKQLVGKPITEVPDFHHPGVAAEQKEASVVLFKAIRRLPDAQQTAFLLQKTEGLSQVAIADIMCITVGAVESLLQRAKTALRKQLADYYQTYK